MQPSNNTRYKAQDMQNRSARPMGAAAPSTGRSAQRPRNAPSGAQKSPGVRNDKRGSTGKTKKSPKAQVKKPGNNSPAGSAPVRAAPQKPADAAARSGGFVKAPSILRLRSGVDRPLLIIIVILVCFGSVMVFSASFASAYWERGDSYYYIRRQLIYMTVGLIGMGILANIDYRVVKTFTPIAFLITTVLLALVPVYGLATGKAVRWLSIAGYHFQPSEFAKVTLVLILAFYFSKYQDRVVDYRNFWRSSLWGDFIPIAITGFVCLLVALEFHFSCVIILFCIGMIVIFAAGARKIWFAIAGGAGVFAVTIAILFVDYAKKRVDMWLHPENYDSLSDTWQTLQGLYAVGSGGFLGVGLGNSRQKHSFLPEPQNDFIFAIICEELGYVGALTVIALFVALIWRGFTIALKAPDTFSSLVAVGLIGKVAIQAVLNIAVVTNSIPNTGITLPFFSYGGTALMTQLAEMGILLSISRYSSKE